jgi:hypothetical protein
MANYYVNINVQSNGDHEVHRYDCYFLPSVENRIYLGDFWSCEAAVSKAKEYFDQVDGCRHCSYRCHNS